MKKIIVYGPSDKNIPQCKIGGAELGTNRTINLLKKNDYEVLLINKPTLYYGKIRYIIDFLKAKKLVKKYTKEGNNIFYCVGFYYKNSLIERKFINIAKRKGNKIIYEPKNGSLITSFNEGDEKYKEIMQDIFAMSDKVFCQGKVYKNFLDKSFEGKAVYIPNFIKEELIENNKKFNDNSLDLVYWGRITKSKNIDIIVDVFEKVSENIDKKVTLTLIGSFDDNYYKIIKEKINKSNYASNIFLKERTDLENIKKIVAKKHFYLFPSSEKNEGHSNALTEAMAFGIIPIVSDFGFNADIVDLKDLVIDNLDFNIYAKKIIEIYKENKFYDYSKLVIQKVKDNYVENLINKKIIDSIENL